MKKSDFSKCAKTFMMAFQEEPWNEPWTYNSAYNRIEGMMMAGISRGYVACNDDMIVAMLCGRINSYVDAKELFVDEFCILPEYQGRGIGSKMLEFVRGHLKQEGISCMVLNTERDYPAAKFYEKNGFKQKNSVVLMYNQFD